MILLTMTATNVLPGTEYCARHKSSLRVRVVQPVTIRLAASTKTEGVLYERLDMQEMPAVRSKAEFDRMFHPVK